MGSHKNKFFFQHIILSTDLKVSPLIIDTLHISYYTEIPLYPSNDIVPNFTEKRKFLVRTSCIMR